MKTFKELREATKEPKFSYRGVRITKPGKEYLEREEESRKARVKLHNQDMKKIKALKK